MPSPPKDSPAAARGFLLHVFHLQQRGQTTVYAIGKLDTGETFGLVDDRETPGFYVRESELAEAQELAERQGVSVEPCEWTTMDGERVARLSCSRIATLRDLDEQFRKRGLRTYEADVPFTKQWLMKHGLRGAVSIQGERRPGTGVDWIFVNPSLTACDFEPELAVLALDIETDADAGEVWAVSLVGTGTAPKHVVEEVLVVGEPAPNDPDYLCCLPDERQLLEALAARIHEIDPDVLTGWNVVDFDLPTLQKCCEKHRIEFNLGRTRDRSWYREGERWGQSRMTLYGRQVLDAMHLVRATLQRYDDYKLDTVARAILGRGKTLESDDDRGMPHVIADAYEHDRPAFAEYCLEDSRLVRDLLEAEGLVKLSLRRCMLTGLPLERAWGSVAAFEFLYMTELHKRGIVAPTCGVDQPENVGAPGGLVMEPKIGLYTNVFVFDFKSLYPSLMRTFNIDPLAHVKAWRPTKTDVIRAPNDAEFDREPGILPAMLERFHAEREKAKADGDALASFTYKIVQNSFYGVLAARACRFASNQLAGAITGFGQYLLRWTRDLLNDRGVDVIYGDTDSLFVDAGLPADLPAGHVRERGEELCEWINAELGKHVEREYRVESKLELEFEKVYTRFLLPPMRGSDRGRAKGYAGLVVEGGKEKLEIVGMEAVRRDWTRLAHELQRDLLHRLFHDQGPAELEACVAEWVRALRAGEKDDDLVYNKSLRKKVESYTRTTPPHVKAAMQLKNPSGVIHYVMTLDGPQPVGHVAAALDYSHYVSKQIEPIVRTIAQVCPLDVDAAVRGEQSLF